MPDTSTLPKCCLIGESVAGNPSHFMIERAFESAALDWRFLTFEINARRLGEALAGADALGMQGVLLLGPLREAVGGVYQPLTDRARRSGSATCLTREEDRLVADDLTGEAAVNALADATPLAGRRVLLLGAARVAHSLADAALAAGAQHLLVADRNLESAGKLAAALGEAFPESAVAAADWDEGPLDLDEPADVIISSACWPDPRDEEFACAVAEALPAAKAVLDARVGTARTPLAHLAEDASVPVVDGLEILARETALAVEYWTGVKVDRVGLRESAEEFLGI
ncbi:MAG: hypothetical protein AAGJ46_07825 [Planctomycetota bacterium]